MMPQEPEENATNKLESEVEDVEALRKALAEEKARAESNLAGWQRAQADFMNYKKWSEQEKEEAIKFANSGILVSLLPILDDLERAFASKPNRLNEHSWVDGMRLIDRKLRTVLEAQGLSPIEALGGPFDPYLHEAVRQDKGKEGIVIEELQKGYKFRDKVIRPSKVVVGNGEEEETQPGESSASVNLTE